MKSILIILTLSALSCGVFAQNNVSKNEHLTMATLWFQKSAEMKALYYQAFNLAQLRLDQKLQNSDENIKYAVVCDIDETLLNNSPVEAKIILDNMSFSDSLWNSWTSLSKAEALPGALEFAKYAASKNVKVFYLSNRKVIELEWTMKNMKELGFPNVEEEFFLLKTNTSDKEERREKARENYEILLYCGDNLGDFSSVFDDRSANYDLDEVDEYKNDFGDKFIVLPNPTYGTWEKAIYGGTNRISPEEKNKLRKEALISF
jgi:5'-nucleotidase (lipoprotein e(P4) family)